MWLYHDEHAHLKHGKLFNGKCIKTHYISSPIHGGHIIFRNDSFCAKMHVHVSACVCVMQSFPFLCVSVPCVVCAHCASRTTFHSICTRSQNARCYAHRSRARFQRATPALAAQTRRRLPGRHYMHKECFNLLMPASASRRSPLVRAIIFCVCVRYFCTYVVI